MHPSRQQPQHTRGILVVDRLLQQVIANHDNSISAQHGALSMLGEHGASFVAGQPLGIFPRSLVR
jgi:hypothetical protein